MMSKLYQSIAAAAKRTWDSVNKASTWSPALTLNTFSSESSKQLFKEFKYTHYSSMLTKAFFGNLLFYLLFVLMKTALFTTTTASPVEDTLAAERISDLVVMAGGFVFHLIAILLRLYFPKLFRSSYFFFAIMSLAWIQYTGRSVHNYSPGTVIETCVTILFLIMGTIYFQNSTLFMTFFCLLQLIFAFTNKAILLKQYPDRFPGGVPIFAEVKPCYFI